MKKSLAIKKTRKLTTNPFLSFLSGQLTYPKDFSVISKPDKSFLYILRTYFTTNPSYIIQKTHLPKYYPKGPLYYIHVVLPHSHTFSGLTTTNPSYKSFLHNPIHPPANISQGPLSNVHVGLPHAPMVLLRPPLLQDNPAPAQPRPHKGHTHAEQQHHEYPQPSCRS